MQNIYTVVSTEVKLSKKYTSILNTSVEDFQTKRVFFSF